MVKRDISKLVKKQFAPLEKIINKIEKDRLLWKTRFWKAVRWIEKLYTPKLESRDRDIIEMRIFIGVNKKLEEMKKRGRKMNINEASINFLKSNDFIKLKAEYRRKAQIEDNIKGYKPYRFDIKTHRTIKNIFYRVDKKTHTGIADILKRQASKRNEYY